MRKHIHRHTPCYARQLCKTIPLLGGQQAGVQAFAQPMAGWGFGAVDQPATGTAVLCLPNPF